MTPEEALERAVMYAEGIETVTVAVGRDEANQVDIANTIATANAWATIGLALSNLVPLPEDVLAVAESEAIDRLTEVEAILDPAAREGRRHPAIHAALEAIRRPR